MASTGAVSDDERNDGHLGDLIARIVRECPERRPASPDELRAQRILANALTDAGLDPDLRPFRFNTNLYANLALHFGLGTAGSLLFGVAPSLSMVLHATTGVSYLGDAKKRFHLVRRLLPWKDSQNLVASRGPAEPRLRIVLIAHADAALTGWMFRPETVEKLSGNASPGLKRLLGKPMKLAARSQLALAGVDALGVALGPARHLLWPAVGVLSVPALLTFLLNMDVVLRNQVVPGANDNLSGCAALVALASRLATGLPDEVEVVYVVTGCEEAGTGGAYQLCRQMRSAWDRERTVVLAVDGLSGGELCWFQEGDIDTMPVAPWLGAVLQGVAAADDRFVSLAPFEMDLGATDAGPFLHAGYDGVGIGCVDRDLGAPRNYHLPSDTPENLDLDQLALGVDLVEAVVRGICETRVGQYPSKHSTAHPSARSCWCCTPQ